MYPTAQFLQGPLMEFLTLGVAHEHRAQFLIPAACGLTNERAPNELPNPSLRYTSETRHLSERTTMDFRNTPTER
jgi:hypothetical protein